MGQEDEKGGEGEEKEEIGRGKEKGGRRRLGNHE